MVCGGMAHHPAVSCEVRGRPGIIPAKEMWNMATDTTAKTTWVQKTPGVCGGRACIRNARITVWGLVNYRRLGLTDEQILQNIAGLTPEDLQAAWDYYREHPAEIDEDIRENEAD
jgi:uncharacterized protein (DUF433 family)